MVKTCEVPSNEQTRFFRDALLQFPQLEQFEGDLSMKYIYSQGFNETYNAVLALYAAESTASGGVLIVPELDSHEYDTYPRNENNLGVIWQRIPKHPSLYHTGFYGIRIDPTDGQSRIVMREAGGMSKLQGYSSEGDNGGEHVFEVNLVDGEVFSAASMHCLIRPDSDMKVGVMSVWSSSTGGGLKFKGIRVLTSLMRFPFAAPFGDNVVPDRHDYFRNNYNMLHKGPQLGYHGSYDLIVPAVDIPQYREYGRPGRFTACKTSEGRYFFGGTYSDDFVMDIDPVRGTFRIAGRQFPWTAYKDIVEATPPIIESATLLIPELMLSSRAHLDPDILQSEMQHTLVDGFDMFTEQLRALAPKIELKQ
ncbi:MAG: hypothetical protein QY318_01100 [Candidatus Dojkabacteria bacterium]|nr:MAG: hypothetical protein QY318_01100 [Candidatus Dojkabacteria bacterium]